MTEPAWIKPRVEKDEDTGTHTALCGVCGFATSGHPTKRSAEARMTEHHAEHETREPMRPIGDFMAEQRG